MARIFAGTSGFAYPNWKPAFYPSNLPARRFLEHYAERLGCVEINYTFRRLPAAATLQSWVAATPAGFQFAVKAHMRITHIFRLKDAGAATETFLRAIDPLRIAGRLGPILFQLPPQMRSDVPLLSRFLSELPPGPRYAFEFRHDSWLNREVYDALARHNISLCVAESERLEVPEVITADFVYFRLRQPEYSEGDLRSIAGHGGELTAKGLDAYLIFKHEDTPQGALYAERVQKLLGAPKGTVRRRRSTG